MKGREFGDIYAEPDNQTQSHPTKYQDRGRPVEGLVPEVADHSAFTIPSTIFFASANSIIVLSRKNSSFSTPA